PEGQGAKRRSESPLSPRRPLNSRRGLFRIWRREGIWFESQRVRPPEKRVDTTAQPSPEGQARGGAVPPLCCTRQGVASDDLTKRRSAEVYLPSSLKIRYPGL